MWDEEIALKVLHRIKKRLYSEDQFVGDDMRDTAQLMDRAIEELEDWVKAAKYEIHISVTRNKGEKDANRKRV